MKIDFHKFHGAGNDFVIIFQEKKLALSPANIAKICDRKRGVGADGLILLKLAPQFFLFKYYNSDGTKAAFCGNGIRCAALLCGAKTGQKKIFFKTDSGMVSTVLIGKEKVKIDVPITRLPEKIVFQGQHVFLCSAGVPHIVIPTKNLNKINVAKEGKKIRFHPKFAPAGVNVNFVQLYNNGNIKIRTYERGVETETEACGTGVCATAVSLAFFGEISLPSHFETFSKDILSVDFSNKHDSLHKLKKVFLTGPARKVFSGTLNI